MPCRHHQHITIAFALALKTRPLRTAEGTHEHVLGLIYGMQLALLDQDWVQEFLDGFFDSQDAETMVGERGGLIRKLYAAVEEIKTMQFKTS